MPEEHLNVRKFWVQCPLPNCPQLPALASVRSARGSSLYPGSPELSFKTLSQLGKQNADVVVICPPLVPISEHFFLLIGHGAHEDRGYGLSPSPLHPSYLV